jgi:hypothetical protein
VITDDEAGEEGASSPAPAKSSLELDRPVAVYVTDLSGVGEEYDKLEQVVLKHEKVALGMKAFRTVKMTPTEVAEDPLLAGKGTEVPRILLVEPAGKKVTVVEKSKLSAGGLFSAMEAVAGKHWSEKLDKVVKEHLSLLTKQDQVSNEEKVLCDKETRLKEEEPAKVKKDLEKLAADREALQKEKAEITAKQRDLWKLTPKAKTA